MYFFRSTEKAYIKWPIKIIKRGTQEADDTEKAYIKWVLNDNSPNSIVAVKGSGMDIIIGLQTIYDSIIKQVRENMGDSIDKIEEEVLKLFLENHENEQNE